MLKKKERSSVLLQSRSSQRTATIITVRVALRGMASEYASDPDCSELPHPALAQFHRPISVLTPFAVKPTVSGVKDILLESATTSIKTFTHENGTPFNAIQCDIRDVVESALSGGCRH